MTKRARIEFSAAAVLAVLALATVVWPDWIELLTGLDPDRGSGTVEAAVLVVLAVGFVVSLALGSRELGMSRRSRQGI